MACLGLCLLVAWFIARSLPRPTAALWQKAIQAERDGDLVQADLTARQILDREPGNTAAQLLAIRIAVQRQQWQAARDYVSKFSVTDAPDPAATETLSTAGDALFQAGFVAGAEVCFQRVLIHDPKNLAAHTRLAFLLSCQGRRWKSVPHLMELLQQARISADQLLWLADLQALVGDDALLNKWVALDPAAPGPHLGIAIRELARRQPVDAAKRLLTLLAEHPDFQEAGIQLGNAALELGQLDDPSGEAIELTQRATDAFLQWHALIADSVDAHPDLWVLRGRWLLAREDRAAATRCFVEAVRLNPDQRFANYQLAQLLPRDHADPVVTNCLRRVEQLDMLIRTTNLVHDNRDHIELLRQAAEQSEAMGRLWEAWGWCRLILAVEPASEWAWQRSRILRGRLNDERPSRVLSSVDPTSELDLARYPIPDHGLFQPVASEASRSTPPVERSAVPIRFEDVSHDVGLNFNYFNSADDEPGSRSFEFTGGGIAVIDFDVDGWPDLYFTQGCRWPHQTGQQEHLDRLYRNIEGQRFEVTTAPSGIVEDGFSQGATVGDFDSDGFPDLYVANIGPNQFFRNNGDGTFSNVTQAAGTSGDDWSTSAALADVNGDGLPDLYVVNYLSGDDVFTRICHDPDGHARLCYPQIFPAAADRFYWNRGDGTFAESSESSGIRDTNGRGLGIVAADFEGQGRLGFFVANDTTANFYFRNSTAHAEEIPAFTEEGVLSGLAFDFAGQPQAGMGVAAADSDQDGRLDLFVTNFEKEYNNLYRQPVAGLFTDAIATSGMKDASYPMLGFGTQFLDADLDGWPDLFVANGHIDDFTRHGTPYRMPPQFFRNQGPGQFRELAGNELGPYFRGKYLGRAVARLDWNRDGLDDLVIGHLGEPTVLLANRTKESGRFLALELRGVKSSRDAIGTRVELHTGNRVSHYQLTAGDGYQASNDHRLVMGIGDARQVDRLAIWWPSGHRQSFKDLATNAAWLAIEGRDQLLRQLQ